MSIDFLIALVGIVFGLAWLMVWVIVVRAERLNRHPTELTGTTIRSTGASLQHLSSRSSTHVD